MKKLLISLTFLILLSFLPLFSWGQSYGTNSDGFPVYFMRNGRANFAVPLKYNKYLDTLLSYTTGSYTPAQLNALDKLADTLEYYKVFDSLDVFYLHAMDNMHDAMLNWKSTSLSNTYNGTMIDSVIFYPHIGFRRAQYTGSINSNFNPTTAGGKYTLNSASIGFYNYENVGYYVTSTQIGAYDGTNFNTTAWGVNKSVNNFLFNSTLANINATPFTPTTLAGTVNYIRNSSSNLNIFHNSTKYTRTQNSVAMPNRPFYIGSSNYNGVNSYTDRSIKSASWIGGQLTDLQATKISQALELYKIESMFYYDVTWEETNAYYKTLNNSILGFAINILAVNSNRMLCERNDTLYFSNDNGATFSKKRYFSDARKWASAVIFDDGGIVVGTTENQLWKSDDSLTTFTQMTVKNPDGSNFVFHTPASANYKGDYFCSTGSIQKYDLNGKQVGFLGTYSNVALGCAPSNIYLLYGTDSVKVQYRSGINPYYRDNGTPAGSPTTGTLLGVGWNPYYHRHVHGGVIWHDTIYAAFGDSYRSEYAEIMWMKGTYNSTADSFSWVKIVDGVPIPPSVFNEYKSTVLSLVGDTIYFASDGNQADRLGIFKIKPSDVGKLDAIKIYTATTLMAYSFADSNIIMGTLPKKLVYSLDKGNTWKYIYTYEIPKAYEEGYYSYSTINSATSNGWYSMYTNVFVLNVENNNTHQHSPVLMIKPK